MDYERRLLDSQFDVQSTASGFTIAGYAAKFNTRSQDLGGFVETIAPGAFARSLDSGADVRALINHDPSLILGRTVAGTLRVAEDSTGLHYQVQAPDTSYARDLIESMQRGDVTQSSFGFYKQIDDWSRDGATRLRTLLDVDVFDVSPVTYPAYLDTESGVTGRSLAPGDVLRKWVEEEARSAMTGWGLRLLDDLDADELALRARLLELH